MDAGPSLALEVMIRVAQRHTVYNMTPSAVPPLKKKGRMLSYLKCYEILGVRPGATTAQIDRAIEVERTQIRKSERTIETLIENRKFYEGGGS